MGAPCGPPASGWVPRPTACGAIGEAVVVVFGDEVGDGAAQIEEESVAEVAAGEDAAGDDGQIGDGIVAAAVR